MNLSSILSILEHISEQLDDKEGKKESIKNNFDEALGISKEQHDKVSRLIDTYREQEETVEQYGRQIGKCDDEIGKLEKSLAKLRENLDKTTNPDDRDKVQKVINEKREERRDFRGKKERLEESRDKEQKAKKRTERELKRNGVRDIKAAQKAQVAMDKGLLINSKGGNMTNVLKGLKGNIYMAIADGIIKAVEFGIGKATDYVKLNTENTLRELNAVTAVTLNDMRAGFDSWSDAVAGAYSAQQLAIDSQMALMQAENATTLANTKMAHTWTDWIPIWGQINKYQEATLEQEQKIAETRMKNASDLIKQVNEFTKKTDDYIRKQDAAVHAYQRETGMSAAQGYSFEKRMLGQGEDFAKLGKTIEDALKFQISMSEQGARPVNLSNRDYMKSLAVGDLVGNESMSNFASQMQLFNHSVSESADIMYEMYNDVNKMGLSQKKVTKDVLANLKLANRFNFKNGVKGFMDFAKWAENARFNISSLGSMLEKTQAGGLEGVITQSAKLQVLGGNAALYSDPLGIFYDSLNDPKSFAERVKNTFKGYGTTDKNTGETTFSGNEEILIRATAEAWNMSTEEAKAMIREDRKKDIVKGQMGGTKLNDEQISAVTNRAQRDEKSGQWYVNTIEGKRIDVGDVMPEDLKNLMPSNNESDPVEYAKTTMSLVQKIEAATTAISAKLGAATFDNFVSTAETDIHNLLTAYNDNFDSVVKAIEANRADASKAQAEILAKLKDIHQTYADAKTITENKGKATEAIIARELQEKYRADRAGTGKILDSDIDKLKENPQYRKGLTIEEQRDIRRRDTRTISALWDWHRDSNWVPGDEGDDATRYRAKDANELRVEQIGNAHNEMQHHIANGEWGKAFLSSMAIGGGYGAPVHDGFASGNGSPMVVGASNVTPIHDGAVKLAQSDPKDSAIFAKTGGPFDKLFDAIFGKINALYDMSIHNNAVTSNRYGDTLAGDTFAPVTSRSLWSSIHNVGGTSNRYGDTLAGDTFAPVTSRSLWSSIHNVGGTSNRYGDTLAGNDILTMLYDSYSNADNSVMVSAIAKSMGITENDMRKHVTMQTTNSVYPGIERILNNSETYNQRLNPIIPHEDSNSSVIPNEAAMDEKFMVYEPPMERVTKVGNDGSFADSGSHANGVNTPQNVNLNITGRLELTSGGQSIDIMGEIQNNPLLVRRLTEMIITQMNNNRNGGKNEMFGGGRYAG